MSNSPLISYTKLSPCNSGKRTMAIDRITPHVVVGQLSVETIGACFDHTSARASCNYGIGSDGRIMLCVPENTRSWCSSSSANDQRAVTIECASERTDPYAVNAKVYQALVSLCVDICRRNGKTKLLWLGGKSQTLNYQPAANEMVLSAHRWFANKACPGDMLYGKFGDLARSVTAQLGGSVKPAGCDPTEGAKKLYRVQVGAYNSRILAKAAAKVVKDKSGFECFVNPESGALRYHVYCGSFEKSRKGAEERAAALKAKGIGAVIKDISSK